MNDKWRLTINGGLQSISLVLICFVKILHGGARRLYCAGANLHLLVNNNMLTQ